jgi:hypothetical protein
MQLFDRAIVQKQAESCREEYEDMEARTIQDNIDNAEELRRLKEEEEDDDEDNWSEELKLAWADFVIKQKLVPGTKAYYTCKKTMSNILHKKDAGGELQENRVIEDRDDEPTGLSDASSSNGSIIADSDDEEENSIAASEDDEYSGRHEEGSHTNALSHYSTRIYKLSVERRLHFATILGRIWTGRLKHEMIVNPYREDFHQVPWNTVDSLGVNDEIYHRLNDELTSCENSRLESKLFASYLIEELGKQ